MQFDQARLRALHAEGITNRQMASTLGVHHGTIAYQLRKIGLRSVVRARISLNSFPDGTAICSRCSERKPIEAFAMNSSAACGRAPYRLSFCRACSASAATARRLASIDAFLGERQTRLAARARKIGVPFDMPPGHIAAIWRRQGGLCFYTDQPMTIRDPGGPAQVSVDQIEARRGYVAGNVVLCGDRVNTIKHDMTLDEMKAWVPGWYDRLVRMWRDNGITCFQVQDGDF